MRPLPDANTAAGWRHVGGRLWCTVGELVAYCSVDVVEPKALPRMPRRGTTTAVHPLVWCRSPAANAVRVFGWHKPAGLVVGSAWLLAGWPSSGSARRTEHTTETVTYSQTAMHMPHSTKSRGEEQGERKDAPSNVGGSGPGVEDEARAGKERADRGRRPLLDQADVRPDRAGPQRFYYGDTMLLYQGGERRGSVR